MYTINNLQCTINCYVLFFFKKKFKFAPDDSYKIKINMYIKLWKYLLILAHGIHNNNNSKFNDEDGEISDNLSRFFFKVYIY